MSSTPFYKRGYVYISNITTLTYIQYTYIRQIDYSVCLIFMPKYITILSNVHISPNKPF
nr:MAG TPA: hypothetical protein [Caudoviricetes sp.]